MGHILKLATQGELFLVVDRISIVLLRHYYGSTKRNYYFDLGNVKDKFGNGFATNLEHGRKCPGMVLKRYRNDPWEGHGTAARLVSLGGNLFSLGGALVSRILDSVL